jgi:serine/threonine-protein kinase
MAPEQLVGEPVDHRADLFSVGVMLWEAVVGQRLWQGLTDGEIMQHLLSQNAPPRLPRGRGFPPGLAAICARALALDPNERYASASEFESDLATVSTGSMPAQTRLLGGLVTRIFASSRALSRTMLQQSLPSDKLQNTSATLPANSESGDRPRFDGIDEKRPSASFLATMHDDITQVSPLPSHPTRPSRWLPWAAAVLLLGAAGIAGARVLPRRSQPRLATVVANAPVPPQTVPSEPAIAPTPPPQTPPEPANTQSSQHRTTAASSHRLHPMKSHTEVVSSGTVPTIVHDVFDTPVRRILAPRPVRAIDREDPYGP